MNKSNLLACIALALIAAFVILFPITRMTGISLKEMVAGVLIYSMYGILLIAYLLRFALIFLGVFAVYRIIKERQGRQMAV